jgi:hypothetical protein
VGVAEAVEEEEDIEGLVTWGWRDDVEGEGGGEVCFCGEAGQR